MKNLEIETILFKVLLIRDSDILGLGGAGREHDAFSRMKSPNLYISVKNKTT